MSVRETNDLRAVAGYDAASRLAEFRKLRARGALCVEATEQFAAEAASEFLARFESRGEYLRDAVTLLAEIAILEEPCLAEPGHRATFPLLVEYLSDSFNPRLCSLYDRAFAQMISVCRRLPNAARLDYALKRFGLEDEAAILERKARLKNQPMPEAAVRARVRKALVLSRVTLGAEVAITSVVLQKANRSFPNAERVVVGSPKILRLFGGDSGVRLRKVHYPSNGGLLERLLSSVPVIDALEQETRELRPEEYVVIDPDSRLLQLGLLPPVRDESRYFFLESRACGELGDGSMSRITLRWLNSMFGDDDGDAILPAVSLRSEDKEFGQAICEQLRQRGSHFLVAVSFGVGGNEQKRISESFEQELVLRLVEGGSTVLLDKGLGDDEAARASRLAERVRSSGGTVVEIDANHLEGLPEKLPQCRMLTWQGDIGRFAALIGRSDEYIGYDSAGQHIAAALGVPTIDIFTNYASPVFQERWTPSGRASVYPIAPNSLPAECQQSGAVLDRVIACHNAIKSRAPA